MFLDLPRPFFVLAPMDDVTDLVFRQIVTECAPPDLCFTEFVNADGLMSPGRKRLIRKFDRTDEQPPLIAHIWGSRPENFYKVAQQIASGELADEMGLKSNFAGIDLNMGCPVKTVTKMGVCSALIKNPDLAKEFIDAVKQGSGGRLPVSVKTRIGFNSIDPSWTQFLLSQELSMLTIHLRTAKEMSLVPAHYEELERIAKEREDIAPNTLLVANGDILTRQQGEALAKQYGLDGLMIGRGVFHDPYVFSKDSPWESIGKDQRIKLFIRHLTLYQNWAENPDKAVARLNKYAKIYLNGFNGAKELRENLSQAKSISEMLEVINMVHVVVES